MDIFKICAALQRELLNSVCVYAKTEFLTSTRNKKLLTAEPIGLLHYIKFRQKQAG